MFAVPGWSLSASAPKTQTDFGSRQNSNALQNGATAEVAPAKSKKRKRGGRPSSGVTGENVAELWEQHIEGKKAKKPSGSQLKRERKERKQHDGPALAEDDANGVDDGESEVMHSGTPSGVTSDTPGQHAEPESKAEKKSKKHKKDSDVHTATTPKTTIPQADKPAPPLPPATKLTPLQAAMRQKLISARFRHLNQTLYTTPSSNSLSLFAENPDMFEDYHSGFRQQVSVWPENPVDGYVRTLQERGKVRPQRGGWKDKKGKIAGDEGEQGVVALPRTEGTCTVADLGCGDASLSSQLTASKSAKKLKLNILSFDLHSPSPL
ncbi:25S rRNA (adenine645-N1)-methyltransferase, partial [Cryomyces antarcticus]